MEKITAVLFAFLLLATSCEFSLKAIEQSDEEPLVEVLRYDRLESRYLTTGDFSALQQINTDYAEETRTLIENMLHLGEVRDPSINSKFLSFYQDTVLQAVILEVQTQYADMDDINESLSRAFRQLQKWLPDMEVPVVYAQIGAFGQSIVVGEKKVGISLDKYLGADYPYYVNYFTQEQMATMKREYIVPDCLAFYILSLYGLPDFEHRTQKEKDLHMGKVMWTVNKALGTRFFKTTFVQQIDRYMASHPSVTVSQLLKED